MCVTSQQWQRTNGSAHLGACPTCVLAKSDKPRKQIRKLDSEAGILRQDHSRASSLYEEHYKTNDSHHDQHDIHGVKQ